MATFVLVHGGGHGGWCYQRLARLLRAEGHEVYCPTLTGLGERAHLLNPSINLDTHIEDVVQLLFHEDLRDVYLAGHSYGGMVITGVADRALDRVGHMVFLDASLPRNGEALSTLSPALMDLAHRQARIVGGVELVLFPDSDAVAIYGVTDPDDAAWMAPRLTPHPWACFTQPLRMEHETDVLSLPRTSINCTSTLKLRPPEFLHRTLEGDHIFEIDTGHDLMITEPRKVADMLIEVVRREEAKARA
jgi:pimeloyl-ACP methyl ester carboxylesterase